MAQHGGQCLDGQCHCDVVGVSGPHRLLDRTAVAHPSPRRAEELACGTPRPLLAFRNVYAANGQSAGPTLGQARALMATKRERPHRGVRLGTPCTVYDIDDRQSSRPDFNFARVTVPLYSRGGGGPVTDQAHALHSTQPRLCAGSRLQAQCIGLNRFGSARAGNTGVAKLLHESPRGGALLGQARTRGLLTSTACDHDHSHPVTS